MTFSISLKHYKNLNYKTFSEICLFCLETSTENARHYHAWSEKRFFKTPP